MTYYILELYDNGERVRSILCKKATLTKAKRTIKESYPGSKWKKTELIGVEECYDLVSDDPCDDIWLDVRKITEEIL